MIWRGQRESDNVVDQRGMGGKAVGGAGLILGAIVVYLLGGNPLAYIAQNANTAAPVQQQQRSPASSAHEDDQKKFVSVVLADTEDVWSRVFAQDGRRYVAPKLVLFRGLVDSGCGRASRSSGPFYCPQDQRVYLDLGFLDELSQKFGASGDFAAAYVIAHEIGHHVQNLLGIERAYEAQASRADERSRNQLSVQIELQADCLAGVWAKQARETKNIIEEGDVDEALRAAAAVGDDRLQKRAQGYVVPDSFTHGSSASRVASFQKGFDGGEITSCTQ